MSQIDAATQFQQDVGVAVGASGLQGNALKSALRGVISAFWPSLPPYSTLEHPKIEEVQKATVGVGVALTFKEHGIQKVVMLKAGANYPAAAQRNLYMIPGGFINLTSTAGSSQVAAQDRPESPRVGAAREIEEELRLPDGSPLLSVDPSRLRPMDTQTLALGSGAGLVVGMMLELTPQEVATVKAHVNSIQTNAAYAQAVADQSISPHSGKPEVADVVISPLKDLAEGKVPLLHSDQQSLFEALHAHFGVGPARSI